MSVQPSYFHRDADYPFLSTVAEIRLRIQQHMQRGAVTPTPAPGAEIVLQLLGEALAFQLARMRRYRKHASRLAATASAALAAEFLQFSQEEQYQAARITERIVQLGGRHEAVPHSGTDHRPLENAEGETLVDTIEEDLIAERIATDSYREIIQYLREQDVTTQQLLESILAVEEQHMAELANIRERLLRAGRATAMGVASGTGEAARVRGNDQTRPE